MRRILQGAALASVLVLAGMAGPGATTAKAQGFGAYPGYYGRYGAGRIGGGYLNGYGVGIATYPVPVIVNRPFGGYGGYGGYGRGYAGYAYPRHYRHHHHRFRY